MRAASGAAGGVQGGWLLLLAGVALLPECEAAGGVSIFALGKQVDEAPWDVLIMYLAVFGITLVLEYTVDTLHHKVHTRSGTRVVHHITEEVMILGGISAVLVVFENLGGAALIDTPLFHYVHFVIFVMAIMFITLVTSLFNTVGPAWKNWDRFENKVLEIESDPSISDEERGAFLMNYVRSVSDGPRMLSCLCYFRQNLPERFVHVSFCRYMKKMQRIFMLQFLNLHIKSWFFLGVLCLLAAITDKITITISENPLATIGLWVALVGLGPLLVLVILAYKMKHEFNDFAIHVQEMRQSGAMCPTKPQSAYFWQGSPAFSVQMIQCMLLYQVFYLATTVVNFVYRLWMYGAANNDRRKGFALIMACFVPSAAVFFVVLPMMLPTFTILASLGEFMDQNILLMMLQQDKESGKWRRMFHRDSKTSLLAENTRIVRSELLLCQQDASVELAIGLPPVVPPWEEDAPVTLHREDLFANCTECELRPAKVKCNRCGLLCDECDTNYHRLRPLKNHARKLFEEEDEASMALLPSFSGSLNMSLLPTLSASLRSPGLRMSTKTSASTVPVSPGSTSFKPPKPGKPPPPLEPPPATRKVQLGGAEQKRSSTSSDSIGPVEVPARGYKKLESALKASHRKQHPLLRHAQLPGEDEELAHPIVPRQATSSSLRGSMARR
ncbi:hypothetical protein DIPPA_08659 [Diplonema papillatum]|nr:hypothetical protein DIPPA_08659 [Diplonema papillatum]